MSLNRLEQVVYDLGVKGGSRKQFSKDPERFLDGYYLDASEKEMVMEFNVARLIEVGVSPLLTMGFWVLTEPSHSVKKYLLKLSRSF